MQRYKGALGRMQLMRRHPGKYSGDRITGFGSVVQVPMTLMVIVSLLAGLFFREAFVFSLAMILILILMNVIEAIRLSLWKKDFSCLLFPFVFLLRDGVWSFASLAYYFRRRNES